MTKEEAIVTPMIELAEILVSNVEIYKDHSIGTIAISWDRYDLIKELEWDGYFDEN